MEESKKFGNRDAETMGEGVMASLFGDAASIKVKESFYAKKGAQLEVGDTVQVKLRDSSLPQRTWQAI